MQARDDLNRFGVELVIVDRVRKARDKGAAHVPSHDRESLVVLGNEVLKGLDGRFKAGPASGSFCFIPGAGFPEVAAGREPVDNPHGGLLGSEEPRLHVVPAQPLRIWIRQAPIELFLVPLRYRHPRGVGGNAVPDLLEQIKTLLDREPEDFV